MNEPTSTSSPEERAKPPGVLPKNLQAWVIGGIALVMMMIIAFSGGNAPKPATPVRVPGTYVADPNAERIQEYRARIEQQLERLAQEQARLSQDATRLNAGATSATSGGGALPAQGHLAAPASRLGSTATTEKSWIELDREKRLYESRYTSSVALTRRQTLNSSAAGPLASGTAPGSAPAAPADPAYRILEGTMMETVLTNRLDGTFSGPVNCMVTTPVYSENRRRVLIPRGSRVLGKVQPVESFGQQRLAVSFHRLILPNKTSVALDSPPALSQVGETGLLDKVDRHYGQIFGVSLAIGAIAGLSQINTASSARASTADVYRQGVASSVSQTSLNILDRFLNVLPTFTIREGTRIKIYITRDFQMPAPQAQAPHRTVPPMQGPHKSPQEQGGLK